jgi:hypothetical protein
VDNAAGTGRGVGSVTLDGQRAPGNVVTLRDGGCTHNVRIVLGIGEG